MNSTQKLILSCTKLRKMFGAHSVLENISFSIHQGEKVGLVGPNGSGKTTLLKMIIGQIPCEEGIIDVPKRIKQEYFSQIHDDVGLSGGETAKKILAPIMKSDADIFLLDEPTNNLDSKGLETLEAFVIESKKSFLVVSHDREFLDRTVTKIIEIDGETRKSTVYNGNYSQYAEQRISRIELMWKEYADKKEKTKKYSSSIDQKISWKEKIEQKRKDVRNLPIHEKEKPVASILRDQEGRMGRRSRIIKDRLEKYQEQTEEIVKPSQPLPLHIVFEEQSRGGTNVFDLDDVCKKFTGSNLGPIMFSIQYGNRILLQGNNGAGKSTLLKMLIGEIQPDEGIIKRGVGIHIGYIAQNRWQKESNDTALDSFMNITGLEDEESRRILHRFRISSEDVHKTTAALSPGEYSRLMIASLVAQKPNCIILDEPTNHLDLEALEELEKSLSEFKGTLIVVSHDRYFIKKIRLSKIYALENGRIRS